ncbi:MAG: peptidoglycan-binding protein, partial [Proteobacteria bacterium]|nr:peptidoglycan-binding protein [Pseudomonadota bacterium]
MYNPFQLTSTLASNATADEDDTVAAKQAFGQLGYYQTPSYGLTPYPDQGLFDGIKKFQKDNDLTVDGVMQPA